MWFSIMGMYEYDNTVFNGFDAPSYIDENDVVHTLNRDDVINNILLQCAELEVVYPSIEMMKFAIGVWSASNQRTWDKLYKSMYLEYNPIWNVDADETIKLQHGHTETRTPNLTDTRTPNLTDTQRPNTTSTESVQGFNSSSWSESKKVVDSGSVTLEQHGTETDVHTGTDTMAHTGMDTTTVRRTGNIGVTASQDLIKREREISEFSIIEYITQSFKERFCILIY